MLLFPIGGPWMHIFRNTQILREHGPYLSFSFPSMATGGPWMAISRNGAGHRWITDPIIHRWECRGLPMAISKIPWKVSTVCFGKVQIEL